MQRICCSKLGLYGSKFCLATITTILMVLPLLKDDMDELKGLEGADTDSSKRISVKERSLRNQMAF